MEKLISEVLATMPSLNSPQKKFIAALFIALASFRGKANYRNLSRFSNYCEKTFSRWYLRYFNFTTFNKKLIAHEFSTEDEFIGAIDASFLRKSGKSTAGLGMFYCGSTGSAEKGLEVSLISLVHLKSNTAYALHAKQTIDVEDKSRTVLYADQAVAQADYLLSIGVRYIVSDSYYTKKAYVSPVTAKSLEIVGKLRNDSDLKWLYKGEYSGKGRPRKYDGKLNIENDIDRFEYVGKIEDEKTCVYTEILYSPCLKRQIRVVLLCYPKGDKTGYALLYSTDIKLDAMTLIRFYKARFQIEFIFRDAKQHTGLMDCQSCKKEAINTHLNASFSTLNLMKIEDRQSKNTQSETVISIASWKRRKLNQAMMRRLFQDLEIDQSSKKVRQVFDKMSNFGVIAA